MSQPSFTSGLGYVSEDTVTLNFNAPLDAAQPPLISAFSAFKINGTPVTISGLTVDSLAQSVTLRFSASLTTNDIVEFDYTDPTAGDDANAIQGVDGADAASFSNSLVISSARPNVAPTFVGSDVTLSVAQNGGAVSAKPLLHVSDINSSQTLYWTISLAPSQGTLSLSGTLASSGSADITPGGLLTYRPDAGFAGVDSFAVQVSDGQSTATRTITVNVAPGMPGAPDLGAASDSGASSSDNITQAAALTLSGTSAAGDSSSTVRVFVDANNNGAYDAGVDPTATATVANGAWTVSGLDVSAAADGAYNVYAEVTSASGGVTSARSTGLAVQLDRTAPTQTLSALSLSADTGVAGDFITRTAAQTIGATLSAALGAGDVLYGSVDGGGSWTDITSKVAGTTVSWNGATLSGSNSLRLKVVDAAGNEGVAASQAYALDTTAPAAPATPNMTAGTDTGASNSDDITADTTPSFTGTAEANATVELYDTDGVTVLASGTANGAGNWLITSSALNEGAHTISAKATDVAGNVSAAGGGLAVVVDTTAPTVSIASSASTLKVGETATITFTFSEDPGATFTWNGAAGDVGVSGGTLGAISGSGLTRTATFTPDVGANAATAGITVTGSSYTDLAGNGGGAGTTPALSFDTLAPAAPSTPDLVAGSDTGASSSDNITDARTPTFTGTAEAGATVRLYDSDGTTVLGSAVATGGLWSISASTLALGVHTVTARATDAFGNVSAASTGLAIRLRDNTAPTGAVSFTGTAKAGETLTAANTLADVDGLGTIGYQWQRGGVDIGGATAATYTLVSADVASQVRVVARYTDQLGSSESVASAPAAVSSGDVAAPLVISTPMTFTAAAGSTVTLSGPLSGAAALTFSGGGTVILSGGGAYAGTATVAGGVLSVNGALPGATIAVNSGGTLGGTGTVGAVNIASGGALAAGNSPGVLHMGDMSLAAGAAFNVEIASGASHDRADVTGAVSLGGASLNLTALGGFAPQAGQAYTIVANDGADAVTGTFAGLAEGGAVTLAGVRLTISYRGGDGNDVTLSAPAAPSGGTTPPVTPGTPTLIAAANQAVGFDVASAKAVSPTVVTPAGQVAANPNYATALAVQVVQADYAAGRITPMQATAKLIDLAMATKGVAIEAYSFFTGAPPSAAGMAYLVNSDANPNDLTDPYYAGFNTVNRYINFAVNLGANGEGRAAFAAAYEALSFEQAVTKAYDAVIGLNLARAVGYDTTASVKYVAGQQAYFQALGGGDIGAKAAMVGYLLSVSADVHLGSYQQAAHDLIGAQITLVGGVSAF